LIFQRFWKKNLDKNFSRWSQKTADFELFLKLFEKVLTKFLCRSPGFSREFLGLLFSISRKEIGMIAIVKRDAVYSVKNMNNTFINKICVCLNKGEIWDVEERNYTETKKSYTLSKEGNPDFTITATRERLELYFDFADYPNTLQRMKRLKMWFGQGRHTNVER